MVVNADGQTVAVVAIYVRSGVAVAVGAADVKKKEKKEEKTLPVGVGGRRAVVVMVDMGGCWPTCGGGGEREREEREREREREGRRG